MSPEVRAAHAGVPAPIIDLVLPEENVAGASVGDLSRRLEDVARRERAVSERERELDQIGQQLHQKQAQLDSLRHSQSATLHSSAPAQVMGLIFRPASSIPITEVNAELTRLTEIGQLIAHRRLEYANFVQQLFQQLQGKQ